MQHNTFNENFVFYKEPLEFNKNTDKDLLQYCLGGTLYMPSTKQIADKIIERNLPHLASMVMCFEDAISIDDLPRGEENVLEQLEYLHRAIENKEISFDELPLIFLRVRNTEQFLHFSNKLSSEHAKILAGFVFPKFYSENAFKYLDLLSSLNEKFQTKLYGMPILEGKEIAHTETRIAELEKLRLILSSFKELILNIRIGGTDFSSIFGLRRSINTSIYDILAVRDIISDILNMYSRADSGYVISSPVWEYFLANNQAINIESKGQSIHHFLSITNVIFDEAVDGLIKEILLDKTNGMVGKTVIHPTHLRFINALQAVTKEEYLDAEQILSHSGGVLKSENNNKMNEIGPHFNWAKSILQRAKAYGVIEDESDYFELFKH